MTPQPERTVSRLFLLIVVILLSLFALNCTLLDLFMVQHNQDRTATSFAVDTIWCMTYTEEARLYNDKTATSEQATDDAQRATQQVGWLTFDARMRNPHGNCPGSKSTGHYGNQFS